MKALFQRGSIPGALIGLMLLLSLPGSGWTQVRIIFDTDMDTDCDDAGALAVLHALADQGQAHILATIVSSRYPWSAPCVAAINRYYGRPELSIGSPRGDGVDTGRRGSRYARRISETFPTRLKSNDDAPSAVAVYRRLLAGEEDRGVVIVTVGYVTNLRDLLASPADAVSSWNGRELIERKVKLWVCMGGRYPRHLDPGVFGNFKPDPAAAVTAVREWPGPIVFTGLGDDVLTGARLNETPPANPVRRIYELYLRDRPTRPSWDPIAVLYAVRPQAAFWEVRRGGRNHIFDNGTNEWRDGPESHHRLLALKPGSRQLLQDTLDELMVQSPRRKRTAD